MDDDVGRARALSKSIAYSGDRVNDDPPVTLMKLFNTNYERAEKSGSG
jgi:hypothetical protein